MLDPYTGGWAGASAGDLKLFRPCLASPANERRDYQRAGRGQELDLVALRTPVGRRGCVGVPPSLLSGVLPPIAECRARRASDQVVDPLLRVTLVAELVEERSRVNLALRRVPRAVVAEHFLEQHAFGPIAGTIGLASTVGHRYRH